MSQSSCMLYLTHAYFKIKLSVGHKIVVKENKVRKQRKKNSCCTSITAFAVFVRFFIGIVMTS